MKIQIHYFTAKKLKKNTLWMKMIQNIMMMKTKNKKNKIKIKNGNKK